MPKVLIAGGGLAGLSAAAALGSAGFEVDLFESRAFLGGAPPPMPSPARTDSPRRSSTIASTSCCAAASICSISTHAWACATASSFTANFIFSSRAAASPCCRRGRLPAPFHFTGSFLRMHCLGRADKRRSRDALYALRRERTRRKDLDRISMLDWLLQKRQTPHAIDRFWRQVLVSAVNEDLDKMAAIHGFQVFWLGFLARADSYEMGVPSVSRSASCTVPTRGSASATCTSTFAPPVEKHRRRRLPGRRRAAHGGPLHLRAALRAAGGGRADRAEIRALADHRRPPLVRPRSHRRCRTPRCSTAPCSGCSTRTAAGTCNWWSVRRAI